MTVKEFKQIVEELDSESRFFNGDYEAGFADAKAMMLKTFDKTAEPVGNFDKMTLAEFAHEMGKFFNIKYVTFERGPFKDIVNLWEEMPTYVVYDSVNGDGFWQPPTRFFMNNPLVLYPRMFKADLDLSEYEDENGKVDCSKCIVEVQNDTN